MYLYMSLSLYTYLSMSMYMCMALYMSMYPYMFMYPSLYVHMYVCAKTLPIVGKYLFFEMPLAIKCSVDLADVSYFPRQKMFFICGRPGMERHTLLGPSSSVCRCCKALDFSVRALYSDRNTQTGTYKTSSTFSCQPQTQRT